LLSEERERKEIINLLKAETENWIKQIKRSCNLNST